MKAERTCCQQTYTIRNAKNKLFGVERNDTRFIERLLRTKYVKYMAKYKDYFQLNYLEDS